MNLKVDIVLKVAIFMLILFGLYNTFNYFSDKYFFSIPTRDVKAILPNDPSLKVFSIKDCTKENMSKCLEKQVEMFQKKNIDDKYIMLIYSDLNILLKERELDSAVCHVLSHKIGEKVYESSLDLTKVFLVNVYDVLKDYNCSNGYYHGLMLGLSKNIGSRDLLLRKLKNLIVESEPFIKKISIEKDNVVILQDFYHGLGHATFAYTNDRKTALEMCTSIFKSNDEQKNLCFTGVYMEDSFQRMDIGENFEIAICEGEDEIYKNACYAGARASEKYLFKNADLYIKQCNKERQEDNKLSCIRGYSTQMGHSEDTLKQIKYFCNSFDAEFSNICYLYYVSFYSGNFSLSKEERVKLVNTVCLNWDFLGLYPCRNFIKNYSGFLPVFDRINKFSDFGYLK